MLSIEVKCNTDSAIKGSPDQVVCDDIFWDNSVAVLGCFIVNLDIFTFFLANLEFMIFTMRKLVMQTNYL
ncbi:hypothetical protein CR513_02773, partial [Mucuna pruriens]